jgi:hypothetical protein
VVTSGFAGIEPPDQGRRMGARLSQGGTLLLGGRKWPGSVGLAGNGATPALGLTPPRRRGNRRRASPLDRVQEEEGEGEVACAPLRWRLAEAADYSHPHTRRPPSTGGGEDLSPSVCRRRRTALQTLTI